MYRKHILKSEETDCTKSKYFFLTFPSDKTAEKEKRNVKGRKGEGQRGEVAG